MKQLFVESIIFCLIFGIGQLPANGLVKRLSAKTHVVPNTLALSRYINKNSHRAKYLTRRQNLPISQLSMDDTGVLLVTNITIGTPPQNFLVEVDLWVDSELSVLNANTNLSKVNRDIPRKDTYNFSESSTFVAVNGNYTNWCGDGHLAKDLVNIDNLHVNATFGAIDELGSWLSYQPVDGTLGLSPKENSANNISLINQLVGHLDKPILSFFSNRSASGTGNSLVVLGAEDTENCQTNWVYVPQEGDWCDVHATSASAVIGGSLVTVQMNTTLAVLPYSSYISVPNSVKALFVNAGNAVYNRAKKLHEVNCNVSKAAKVTFCLGGHDNVIDSTSRILEFSGADYIRYNPKYDLCYLAVYGYKDASPSYNYIEIPHQFFNNHCIAYNIQNKQLGFADTMIPNVDPRKYSA